MFTLARDSSASTHVIVLVGVLIALVIAGGVVVMLLRKRLLAKDDASADVGLFDALKQMRDRGEMTQEEYEAARRKVVEKTKAAMKASGSAKSRGAGKGG
jgi:predicted nucleic acid-binding Zn ribbon protein